MKIDGSGPHYPRGEQGSPLPPEIRWIPAPRRETLAVVLVPLAAIAGYYMFVVSLGPDFLYLAFFGLGTGPWLIALGLFAILAVRVPRRIGLTDDGVVFDFWFRRRYVSWQYLTAEPPLGPSGRIVLRSVEPGPQTYRRRVRLSKEQEIALRRRMGAELGKFAPNLK